MKKIYLFIIATAIAFTSGASPLFKVGKVTIPVRTSQTGCVGVESDRGPDNIAAPTQPAAVESRATSDNVSGDYTLTVGDYYMQGGTEGPVESDCRISIEGETATLSSDYFPLDVTGVFSLGAQSITFSTVRLGQFDFVGGDKMYVAFVPFKYIYDSSTETGSVVDREFAITYADGAFKCPTDHGFSWKVYSDAEYSQLVGYIDMFDLISLAKKSEEPGTDPDEGWITLEGKATLADPWLLPRYGYNAYDDEQYRYEVTVQQNVENSNVYRLVDPYKGASPVASINKSTERGYIQFDVTDPDHVTFAAVDAGFVNSDEIPNFPNGIEKLYCLNRLSYYSGLYNWSSSQVIMLLGSSCPFTTYKDGKVLLSGTDLFDDAIVGLNDKPFGGFRWTVNGEDASMKGYIIMPTKGTDSIGSIEEDSADEVRYYNLQGIETATPAKGQIVIRVQGSKATKIIF